MKTLSRFVTKSTRLIVAVLSCFDRVLFKGHRPITNGEAREGFVDHVLKIRRCDFMDFAQEQSDAVVNHAKGMAEEAGVEYRFLQRSHRNDKLVDEILRQRSDLTEGLVGLFCCMECCPSFRLASGKDRPRLVNARRQQRVLYFHFLDPQLGLIHIRLATWFPFTIQVYVNGHSWLAQEMLKRRLGFSLQDNAFTALDVPAAAQELADSFTDLKWTKILDRLARQVKPLMFERWFRGLCDYGVVDQAEYATDLIFTSREALAGLYPRLLDHAAVNFSAKGWWTTRHRRIVRRRNGPSQWRSRVEATPASIRPALGTYGCSRPCSLVRNLLHGFRNADIRVTLHGDTEDAADRRRQSHSVGRMLKRLHARGPIVKVPRSHRWHVSKNGHPVLGAVVPLYHHGIPAAISTAA